MTRKVVIGFLLILALGANRPAEAARIDVLDRITAAGAGGVLVTGLLQTWTGDFTLDVESEVWRNTAGVYTYFYELSNTSLPALDPVETFNLLGAWIQGGSSTLDWGNIDNEAHNASLQALGDVSFGGSMTVSFSDAPADFSGGIGPGDFLTFYVQSNNPPGTFAGSALDTVRTDGTALAPMAVAPVPEPGSMALIGSGLVGLYAAAKRRRRQLKG